MLSRLRHRGVGWLIVGLLTCIGYTVGIIELGDSNARAVATVAHHLKAVQTHNVKSLRAACYAGDRRAIIEVLHVDWPIFTSNVAASHDPTGSVSDRRNRGQEADSVFAGMKLIVADHIDPKFASLLPRKLARILIAADRRDGFSCTAAYHLP
jgi:hypothetical protein